MVSKEQRRQTDRRPADDAEQEAHGSSGRVKFDERGNAVWDWQVTTQGMTSSQRLRRLDNGSLSLAEDAPTPFDKVRANPQGTKKGYNPYDSGKLGKTNAAPKRKDLRRLSDWFKLRKQLADFKKKPGKD